MTGVPGAVTGVPGAVTGVPGAVTGVSRAPAPCRAADRVSPGRLAARDGQHGTGGPPRRRCPPPLRGLGQAALPMLAAVGRAPGSLLPCAATAALPADRYTVAGSDQQWQGSLAEPCSALGGKAPGSPQW